MPRPYWSWLATGAVAAIAVGAVVHAVWGGSSGEEARAPAPPARSLVGPGVPPPGLLSGTLYFTTREGCRLRLLHLETVSLGEPGLETSCAFWIPPRGSDAAVARPRDGSVWLARVGGREELVRELGAVRGELDWSPDGHRVAWCGEDRTTTVLSLVARAATRLPGCVPRFTRGGAVLTVSDEPGARLLLRDGRAVLEEDDLARGFAPVPSGAIHPLGADERGDGLLAVVVSGAPRTLDDLLEERGIEARSELAPDVWRESIGLGGEYGAIAIASAGSLPEVQLQLWRGRRLEAAYRLPTVGYPDPTRRFGEVVRFSPDGTELAIGYPGARKAVMLVDVGSGRTVLEPTVQEGFAWSPDGTWFALAREDGIAVYGSARIDPAFLLPLAASGLAWR
jgi:hypothetical protein